MYALLALASGVLFGVWKFGLGRYRGTVNPYSVVLVSAAAAAVVYFSVGVNGNELTIDSADVGPGLLGGALNLTGNIFIVFAFQRGKMGVVAGIALAEALVPLVYSLIIGEPLTALAGVGIAVVLVGLLAFYAPQMRSKTGERGSALAIVLALIAALAWGFGIIVIDMGTRVSTTGTMLVSQVPQIAFTLFMVAVVKRSWGGLTLPAVSVLATAGVALGLGNIMFFTAANEGDIGIVTVLGSVSPIVVALMAFAFLSERMRRAEVIAMCIVLVGTSMIVF